MSNSEMGSLHPDLGALAAFIEGRLSEADRGALVLHLSGCLECRTTLATCARGGVPADITPTVNEAVTNRPSVRGAALWLPVAATLALATTAGLLVWRTDPSSRSAAPPPSAPSSASPATSERPLPSASESPVPASPPAGVTAPVTNPAPVSPASGSGSRGPTRGGTRVVGDRTFRLVAGEWIDAAYDPLGLLPVEVIDGQEARASVVTRVPALAPYAALGARVVVVQEGVVYRFRP